MLIHPAKEDAHPEMRLKLRCRHVRRLRYPTARDRIAAPRCGSRPAKKLDKKTEAC
jgi:hypothetical protein